MRVRPADLGPSHATFAYCPCACVASLRLLRNSMWMPQPFWISTSPAARVSEGGGGGSHPGQVTANHPD